MIKASAIPFAMAALLSVTGSLSAWGETFSSREVALTEFKVCADPHNLPFSNREKQGFENKIAALIAKDLSLPLSYVWMPQSVGFVRNTLNMRVCDVVMGVPSGDDLLQNTNPYYRSTYVIVTRKDSGLAPATLSDPSLKGHSIGIIAGTPPVDALVGAGYAAQLQPYHLVIDTRYSAPGQDLVKALEDKTVDVAVLWGPIAGYLVKQTKTPLTVIPLLQEPDKLRIEFRITMGLRKNEPNLKHLLNRELTKLKPQIDAILAEYGVPMIDDDDHLIPPPAPVAN